MFELVDSLPNWLENILFIIGLVTFVIVPLLKVFNRSGYRMLFERDLNRIQARLQELSGRQFELFMKKVFEELGHDKVEVTGETCDGGKDLILDDKVYVECKRWAEDKTVGREICQKLVGAMVGDGVVEGLLVTTGKVHQNARDYVVNANMNNIVNVQIWDMDRIRMAIKAIGSTKVLEWLDLDEELRTDKGVIIDFKK